MDSTSTAVFLKLLKKGVFDNKPIDKYENMTITDCPDVEIRCYRKAKMKYHKWISYGSGTLTREYEPFDKWLVNLINQIIESADNQ